MTVKLAVPPEATDCEAGLIEPLPAELAVTVWEPDVVTLMVAMAVSLPLTPSDTASCSVNGALAVVTADGVATRISPVLLLMLKALPVLPPVMA